MATTLHNAITDIPGIRVDHAQDEDVLTGCTVILCETAQSAGSISTAVPLTLPGGRI